MGPVGSSEEREFMVVIGEPACMKVREVGVESVKVREAGGGGGG